jgi:hypothetical protein
MPLLNYYFLADDLGWGHQDAIPVSTTAFSRALSTAAAAAAVYARPAPAAAATAAAVYARPTAAAATAAAAGYARTAPATSSTLPAATSTAAAAAEKPTLLL